MSKFQIFIGMWGMLPTQQIYRFLLQRGNKREIDFKNCDCRIQGDNISKTLLVSGCSHAFIVKMYNFLRLVTTTIVATLRLPKWLQCSTVPTLNVQKQTDEALSSPMSLD